jgi:hypothetical protein
MRPFHYLIARPYLKQLFGYQPIGEEGSHERMLGEAIGLRSGDIDWRTRAVFPDASDPH